MSSPLQGYPDFARRTPMSDQIIVNQTGSSASTVTFPIVYTANIPAFMLFYQGSNTYSQVVLTWYADAAGTIVLGTSTRDYPPTTFGNNTFRSISPYLKVQVVPFGGPAVTYKIILTTIADVQTPAFSAAYCNLISNTAQGVVGGGQAQQFAQVVPTGQVIWTARCTAVSWDCTLSVQDHTGTLTDIDRCDNTSGSGIPRACYVAGARPVLTLNNHDAGAQTYSMYLNLNPLLGS